MFRGKLANTLDKGCKVWSCQAGRKRGLLQRRFIDVMMADPKGSNQKKKSTTNMNCYYY